jgi:hypothetical protein
VRWLPAKIRFEGGFTAVLFDSVSLNGHLCLISLLVVNGIQIHTETRTGVKAGCNRLLHRSIEGEGGMVYKNNAFSSISLLPTILPLLSSLSDILCSSIVICDILTCLSIHEQNATKVTFQNIQSYQECSTWHSQLHTNPVPVSTVSSRSLLLCLSTL